MRYACLLLLCAITFLASADTNVSGNIGANTTWTLAGSPYILTGNVTIGGASAPTLTIEPGVVVKGNANSQLLVNWSDKGALVANGTDTDPIVFTANGSTTAGFWYGIRFGTTADAPASSMSYTTVEYAGSNYHALGGITILAGEPSLDHVTSRVHQYAGLKIENGTPSITASSVRNNAGHGIYFIGGGATLTDVALTDNTGIAISAPAATQYAGMTGLTASGNGTNGIEFRAGTIAANRTWKYSAVPYIVSGDINVQHASAPILTIEAGCTIRFNTNAQLVFNNQNKGGLIANGTVEEPILFTSNATTPAAGQWYGLYFGATSGGPASSVSYATIANAGNSYWQRGGVTIHALSPSFDHVTIRDNAFGGAIINGGSPSFSSSTFTTNGGPGIYALQPAALTLTSNSFTNNGGYAVTVPATATFPVASGLTASGNGTGRDAIEVRAGTMTASTTWPSPGIPYVISGSLDVMNAAAPVLTIAAGNTIRFNSGAQISVNHSAKGAIQAIGTPSAPILFTSNGATTAGSWLGLWIGPTAAAPQSTIAYATIEYAGNAYWQRGGITVNANAPAFDHVTIRNNVHSGIMINAGSPVIENSSITANSGPGIYAAGGTALTLNSASITNNGGYAVSLPVSVALLDASELTATGNGTGRDAIEVRAGTIVANTTWPSSAIPYVVTGTIDVMAASAPVLTIAAGNTIRFNSGAQISVNHSAKGALQAIGTAEAPIVFTSNGTATAGYWMGLWFGPTAAGPQSNLSYATVEYAGNNYWQRGAVTVNGLSPIFDHVTLRNNIFAGAVLNGGSAVLRDSSITANAGTGINVLSGTSLTLSDNAITNNAGMAVTMPVSTALLEASGLTASGNGTGKDGIEYRAGTITTNTTWPTASIPYVVTGTINVEAAAAPILTIAAGNVIRFNASAQIAVNHGNKGALQANGSIGAPIVFTSNGATTPGHWLGLWFGPTTTGPQSNLSYATIEYGGNDYHQRGGLTVHTLSPVFDHLTLRNNAFAGLMATGNSTPIITNSSFSANPAGVRTGSTAAVTARLNYWNHASGACITGCATGQQSVTAAVSHEPWLVSSPTDPQFVVSATVKNRAFSPVIGAQMTVDYTTALTGDATVTVRNSSNVVVRTFNSSGTAGTFIWDARNDLGVLQPDGTYSYEIASTADAQPPAAIARGVAIVDSTRLLTLSNPAAAPAFFSPNADTVQDTATVTASSNYDDAAWTISILDSSSNAVRTHSGTGTSIAFTWDGRNDSAVVQPDGLYTFRVDVTEGTAAAQKSATSTLDNTPPSLTIATPANDVVSNVYQSGATLVTPTGSVSDANLLNWTMEFGAGASPTSWSSIGSGSAPVTASNLGSWQTANLTNGTFALRLRGNDKAGNPASTTSPVTVGNFKVTQSAYQFNVGTGGTVTYTSTVPFTLTETVLVKNEAGTVVRNLVAAASRAAGTYNDAFDGRNDASALLPDGPYFYVASVTDGTHSMSWDLSTQYRNDYTSYNDSLTIPAYDPFNNVPMRFNYNFTQPARVTIATTTTPGSVVGNCANPTAIFFCPVVHRWEESGAKSFTWSGIDHTGSFRTIRSVGITTTTTNFPKNAAIMFGTKAKVENVTVTPPVYGPATGTQSVEYDLTTYSSLPADITITFGNLASGSALRTLSLPAQAAGHRKATWDGRADNGMLVAPGFYDVIVTATDAQGNVVKSDILTTIKY